MELEYNPGWFLVLIAIGIFFISLAIIFAFQIGFSYSETIYNYKDCIENNIEQHICDLFFPPLKQQNV